MGNESGKHSVTSSPKGSPKHSKKHKHDKPKKQSKEEYRTSTTPSISGSSRPTSPQAGPHSIMISFANADLERANALKSALASASVSAFVQNASAAAAGGDLLTKIGQAIIDAKVFIPILSSDYVTSKFSRDELALAYVSDKVILPVALATPDELFSLMDMGMKLQLARFDWLPFERENLGKLVENIKTALLQQTGSASTAASQKAATSGRTQLRSAAQKRFMRQTSHFASQESTDFWENEFGSQDSVPWASFSQKFRSTYSRQLERLVMDESEELWIMDVLRHELEVTDDGSILHSNYIDFCTTNEKKSEFWTRVEDQVTEAIAIREVFNVESTVRVEAIENLSKFRSSAVVEALLDLLSDKDNNVRTVAAISLARTECSERSAIRRLMRCLRDKDRLVREAGCLALGHLKAKEAVSMLANLWRNDTISSVREAAAVALEQVGGEEAEKAMHVTRVLQEEIRRLNQMT